VTEKVTRTFCRAGSGSDFQAAIQAWQAQHDDAALLAETDRLIAEHQREAATASNAPGSKKVTLAGQ
jgi:hypothetical protein